MKEYIIIYGTQERETIKAANLLNAQKAAHKKAAAINTIALSVKLKNGSGD